MKSPRKNPTRGKYFQVVGHFNLRKRKQADKLPEGSRIQGDQRGKRKVCALGTAELYAQAASASLSPSVAPSFPLT